jgi:hypothetical protein
MNAAMQPATQRRVLSVLVVASLWAMIALPILSGSFSCPTARLTHHPCPDCGMTRAVLLLLSGDVRASLAMHALAIPTFLAQAALAIVSILDAWRAGVPWAMFETTWGRRTLYVLMAVMLLDFTLWIARGCGALGGPVPV